MNQGDDGSIAAVGGLRFPRRTLTTILIHRKPFRSHSVAADFPRISGDHSANSGDLLSPGIMKAPGRYITQRLERAPAGVLNAYAVGAAFAAYFCVYSLRKPFTAATYTGLYFAGTLIELKTAFVVSQILGYTMAKYLGIKWVSEARRSRRNAMLVSLIASAEFALVLFAVLPSAWKVVAIFGNGLALGLIWGLVVRYLEGRRTSDFLLAGLACSFIVASGVFKDIGRALLAGDALPLLGVKLPNALPALSEFWMPAAAGGLLFPFILLTLWLLDQLPEPTQEDRVARTARDPMDHTRRRQFFIQYLPGLLPLIVAYVFLTIFRDFRDNYLVDLLNQLGYEYAKNKDLMTRMELGVALGVLATMGLLVLVKDNRRGLLAVLAIVAAGFSIIGVATLLHMAGAISGFWWIALIGFGGYMSYVPYNSVLFDRLMASTHFVGTAVFAIYLADSAGYTGSVLTQLARDYLVPSVSRVEFLEYFSLLLAIVGTLTIAAGGAYFWRRDN